MKSILLLYSPKGTLKRLEYAMALFGIFVIFILSFQLSIYIDKQINMPGFEPFTVIAFLLWIWGKLCASIKRLNDLNRSAYLSALLFIPGVNLLVFLYLLFAPSPSGSLLKAP
jgi:uncharacterized membrane protein YhaH (DUF805 family)